MLVEELEKAIIHSNVCLKRWALTRKDLLTEDSVKSLIHGWIVRVLARSSFGGSRASHKLALSLKKDLFFTIDTEKWCVTSIVTKHIVLPYLNYEELNNKAIQTMSNSSYPTTLNEFSLESINQIKFR
jgi:hypothetical protein